jgi:hypothetical protein
MGLKSFFKRVKPTKEQKALLNKQYEEGRVLCVNDGKDNKQMMNEVDYATE